MKLFAIFLLALLAIATSASIDFPAHECVRKRTCLSHDFDSIAYARSDYEFPLSFAVKKNNVDRIYEILDDVSDPKSSNYGKYWTFEQMGELTANKEGTEMVINYLRKFLPADRISSTPYGGYVTATVTVQEAEDILDTKFYQFSSPLTGQVVVRTYGFSLPTEIGELIDYVFPTVQFPPSKAGRPMIQSFNPQAGHYVNPSTLNAYYNITSNTVTNSGATQSLFESLGQSFSPNDLTQFQKTYNVPVDAVDTIIGTNTPSACTSNPNNCAEANLDVQFIMAVAQKALTTFWSEDSSTGDIFWKWIQEVASYPNPPLVHSISYGSIEDEMSTSTQTRFDQEAATLGSQGVTIVVSSGDDGVANFGARSDSSQCGFHPSYPATCPHVVAVGATQGPESGAEEIACSSATGGVITTGGGFSTTFSTGSFQTKEVSTFLANSTACPPKSAGYNPNGRGYPDVAMAGYNYQVVIGGSVYALSGTSASAPVFAGVLSLVNNARLNKRKASVGWANPAIYSLFEAGDDVFNDVTIGENNCCAQGTVRTVCCTYGFYATPGWDPLTGLGSVNVGKFVDAMTSL